MRDYAATSFWLETCGDDLTPRPPLDSSTEVDVAIVGGGFTGLWTAYHLLKREPALRVAVLEAEIAGFGASGRNGGWCFSGFPIHPTRLIARYGQEAARGIALAMIDAVDDVAAVVAAEGIDCDLVRSGDLKIARAPYDLPKLEEMRDEYAAVGMGDRVSLLDAAETAARLRVADAVGAFFNPDGAVIQPAKLARGLARAIERRGGTIYEQTRVTDYHGGERPRLETDHGTVRASRAIVLAGEAYLSRLPKLRRHIIPMTSHIVLTDPLPPTVWEQIGWQGRELVGGSGTKGGYLQRTADGRILFGAYRARYPFNSRITDELDRMEDIFAHARQAAREWFPALAGCRFSHAWGGVFGMARDQMPTMGFNPTTKVALAFGYSGQGVATANLSGRTLTDLLTGAETTLTALPTATHRPRPWEPEPIRYAGVSFVRRSRLKTWAEVERTGRYPTRPTLAERLYNE